MMILRKMFLSFFLYLLLIFPICVSIDTISSSQSLHDGDVLLSKNRTFALGFFSPGNSGLRYLGIWYYELPGKAVVWVANRGHPINDSSGVLSISLDGNLVLDRYKDRNFPLWSTNVSFQVKDACVAQLLDSGNLLLVHNDTKEILWQSFDFPSDTMLPGMKLGLDRNLGLKWFLTSWRTVDDPEIGEYSFKLDPVGSPQLFLYKGLTKYWRSSPWPWTHNVQMAVPEYFFKYTFANSKDEIYYTYSVDDKSVFTRSVVDESGLLKRLTWDSTSLQWKISWSEPKYTYGHCGAYSICNAYNADNFECTCLPGYEPKSQRDWYLRDGSGGCVRKRQYTMSLCGSGEGFVKVVKVKLPDASVAALMNMSIRSQECEQLCLRNCSCMAFASLDIEGKEVGCLTWYGELMDVMVGSEGKDMYVRVDAIELAKNAKRRSFYKKKSAITGLSCALTVFLIIICVYFWIRKRKIKGTIHKKFVKGLFGTTAENELSEIRQPPDLTLFDLGIILAATDNFNLANKLGQGGFGSVYKGQLPDGQDIAVKRLSRSSGQGVEEFKNEVMLIARLQHRNLVKLLGCCIQGEEYLLIYEYLPNRSLDFFIFDQRRRSLLDWRKRFEVICGIARGILYLHHDSRLRIVHRDLKMSNVLLDAEMNPKISDFGLARTFKGDQDQDNTNRVVGTYGYMPPEYVVFGKFSIKSDIFSFGIILLEIISGKKSNTCYLEDSSLNLIGHVWDLWSEGKALDIVDSSLMVSYLPPEVFRCIQTALLCVQHDAADRPSMPEVVLMLNGESSLPYPKQPAFIMNRNCIDPHPSNAEGDCSRNEVTITIVEAR